MPKLTRLLTRLGGNSQLRTADLLSNLGIDCCSVVGNPPPPSAVGITDLVEFSTVSHGPG